MELVGRRAEREAVERLLAEARAGQSGSLTISGEAGIGKTALLEHARSVAARSGFRVEGAIGLLPESQFAFGALHQLCTPLLGRLDALPEPQQIALRTAFGQQAGVAPDRFLIGLAVLNLLSEVAEAEPLLCIVDDAHWLDEASAQVLAFVARRVAAEQLALLLCVRDPTDDGDLRSFVGLPELHLTALTESDARALLAAAVPTPLDDEVRDRVVAEARGNPLALLELPRSAPPTRLAGGFEPPHELSVPRRVEEMFRLRSRDLPSGTRLLLLLAAADPTGDAAVLWRAAATLGIEPEAAAPAEAAGLLEIGSRVRFRHPLVRSAVYRDCSEPDRRRVHGALAAATDPHSDPDRRAWHRARAVLGADEEVAAELERSAGRARARGGLAAAAAFLQQAAELTPEPARRASRALTAAQAKHAAGASETALELLTIAASGPLDALRNARTALLRAQISFHLSRGGQVPRMLLDAAETLAPLDPALARETYLDAFDAALITGGEAVTVARAAQAAPKAAVPPLPSDLLLDGLVKTFTVGQEAGAPALRLALRAFRDEPDSGRSADGQSNRWLWLAARNAVGLLDDELVHVLASRHVRLARETGALATLPAALSFMTSVLTLTGELARAGELAAESRSISEAIGAVHLRHGAVMLAAWRGDQAVAAHLNDITLQDFANPSGGGEVAVAHYSMAVLHNGLGNYAQAQAAAALACDSDELGLASVGLPEFIEAAVRTDHPDVAASALEQFSARALACNTPWALGLTARSRALTTAGAVAEKNYREAIEQLGQSRMNSETARAHLVYGEWLRREGRRQDAREQLRTAHVLLSAMGADAFAARAARELRATGEHPRKRSAQPTDALTPHELQIARLVATGATTREVGAQLFLSPRTIEAHLRSIFRKLGITSRRQLKDLQLA
ncbi:AAA family ATPase [Kribbella italica]|uniref:DNA-binding CsgD family transcriptional regulator n=1 Tax=Kribbella italica TaxID=1540520 RepID=A0A7W9J6D7_9ACTN|nr:DNA-binding CsgD family transcriptional regulator [Kribbella italica]